MKQTPPTEDVTSARQDPRILGSNDGKNTDFGSFAVRFMVWREETGGKFSVVEHPTAPRTLAFRFTATATRTNTVMSSRDAWERSSATRWCTPKTA